MKTKFYAGAIFFLMLGLFASGCGVGNIFQPAPTLTPTPSQTPKPTRIPPEQIEIIQKGAAMLRIVGGSFTMGSNNNTHQSSFEKPPHTVTLSTFYMDKYEVTNALYIACIKDGGCTRIWSFPDPPEYPRYYLDPRFSNYPVMFVEWKQAKAYCEWRGARLPTEAQWEYAARGSDGRTYPCNTFEQNRSNNDGEYTYAVGLYENGKSPFGLYDMAGNVSEWVNDLFADYSTSPSYNPPGPRIGSLSGEHVIRGSSWMNSYYSENETSSTRTFSVGDIPDMEVGFRCALPLE